MLEEVDMQSGTINPENSDASGESRVEYVRRGRHAIR